MPVSPADGARYGRQVAGIINQAEITLLRILADTLRKGDPNEENWVADRLAEIQRMRARMVRTATELDVHMADHIRTVILQAYNVGSSLAVRDLDKHGVEPGLIPDPAAAIEASAVQTAQDVHAAIRRTPDLLAGYYRQAVEAAASDVLGGGVTRMQGSQSLLDDLLGNGITGFTDTAGRNWSLDTFAEMAVRTATAQAAVAGHVATLQASGVDLVIISDSGGSCPLCEPWEGKILSSSGDVAGGIFPDVTGGDDTQVDVAGSLDDATSAGLFHPNCFPGDVFVSAPSGIRAADSRWYEGQLVVIHTASGNELPVTPNHPVLTPEGWIAAGALQVGQDVLRYDVRLDVDAVARPDDEQVPASIGQVFHALRESRAVATVTVPSAAEQFHGDGTLDGQVQVVLTGGLLQDHAVTLPGEYGCDGTFLRGGMRLSDLLAEGATLKVGARSGHAADGVVSGGAHLLALLDGHAGSFAARGLTSANADVPGPLHSQREGALSETEGGRDLALSLAGKVTLDRVVELGSRDFAGHVYNLQSGNGWYVAGSIVVHNCTHTADAYLPGATDAADDAGTAPTAGELDDAQTSDGSQEYQDLQRQRAIERNIRGWKRRQALALDDTSAARATAKVGQWQAVMRQHIDSTGLRRLSSREQIGAAH